MQTVGQLFSDKFGDYVNPVDEIRDNQVRDCPLDSAVGEMCERLIIKVQSMWIDDDLNDTSREKLVELMYDQMNTWMYS